MREARFRASAREAFNRLTERDQADVTYLILLLEQNADVDRHLRFEYPRPPLTFRLLDDGVWSIVYHVPDDATVVIHTIVRSRAP